MKRSKDKKDNKQAMGQAPQRPQISITSFKRLMKIIFTTFRFRLLAVVVALVNLVICYSWDSLSKFVKMIVPDNYLIVVLCLIVLVLEVFFLLFVGNFGITIGHRNNDNKMVMSIVVAFGAYMISSTISLIVLFICGLFNNDLMKLFTSNNIVLDAGVLKFTLIVALLI